MRKYKYLYGPVPSRRLGLSLGVDIIPSKYCTYNCIYCQLKATDHLTTERRSFYPVNDILDEIDQKINHDEIIPDYITFSGSGEPTLNSDIGEMIQGIKKISSVPVAVISNGSLLWREDVRNDLSGADLVVPSMDAVLEKSFRKINRPNPALDLETIKKGLIDFRREFHGEIWLEVLIAKDVNDSDEDIDAILQFIDLMQPDRTQFNTVVRPPSEKWVEGISQDKLDLIASRCSTLVDVATVYRKRKKGDIESSGKIEKEISARKNAILMMLERRPCSIKDIEESLGYHHDEIMKLLAEAEAEGSVKSRNISGIYYYESSSKDQ